jgi:hypothetical protein
VSDPKPSGLTEEASIEVELSAQDLLELSPLRPREHPEDRAEPQSLEQHAGDSVGAATKPVLTRNTPTASKHRMRGPLIALSLIAAIAAVTVVGARAQYQQSAADRPITSSMDSSPRAATSVEESAPATEVAQGPPVVFKNPFDATEVFEFPPGTSKAEARAAVADLLLQRATERREKRGARLPRRR